jgi:hypothetical protein
MSTEAMEGSPVDGLSASQPKENLSLAKVIMQLSQPNFLWPSKLAEGDGA